MSFEVGDQVIDIRYGKGKVKGVEKVSDDGDFLLFVDFSKNAYDDDNFASYYTKDGRYHHSDFLPTLYHAEGFVPPSAPEPEIVLVQTDPFSDEQKYIVWDIGSDEPHKFQKGLQYLWLPITEPLHTDEEWENAG